MYSRMAKVQFLRELIKPEAILDIVFFCGICFRSSVLTLNKRSFFTANAAKF